MTVVTRRLFEQPVETPAGTIADENMRLAYGKASTPTLNITIANFVTFILSKVTLSYLKISNNLSDLLNAATSRINLGAANRYMTETPYVANGGTTANPQVIAIDPTLWDIITIEAAAGGWFRFPIATDFETITQGTIVTVRNVGSTSIAIANNNFAVNPGTGHGFLIEYQGALTAEFNGVDWVLISNNIYVSLHDY